MSSEMYGILGTIIGVLLGASVTYVYARKMFNYQRKVEASAAFREVFLDELILCRTKVKSSLENGIIQIIEQNLPKYEKAILRYRPFVPNRSRAMFDDSHRLFTDQEVRRDIQFADISGVSQDVDLQGLDENQLRGKVKDRIERMFLYAPLD